MTRQHCTPIVIGPGSKQAVPVKSLALAPGEAPVAEADIQRLIHEHPGCLPIREIDPAFVGPVPVCRELGTPAGSVDNLMVTASGMPVLVECKLWRNPEGRREVIGQILDYAKELARWSSSDLQREVNRSLKTTGNALLDLVRAKHPDVDETAFNDALTLNLRRGRILLLIVGDGIREGVEAIIDYLDGHAGLHFSFGLIELPIYSLPDGGRLVVPRVLARTLLITRRVLEIPNGYRLDDAVEDKDAPEPDPETQALSDARKSFWTEFLQRLHLTDPEQLVPKAPRTGYIAFALPAPGGSSWLTVYRDMRNQEVGVFLSSSRNTPGETAMFAVCEAWDEVSKELGGTAKRIDRNGRPTVADALSVGSLDDSGKRERAFIWLRERTDTFISVLRPRIRAAVADLAATS